MTSLKILIVPSVIAFVVLFGIFWIFPEYQDIQTKKNTLQERQNVLKQSEQIEQNSATLLQSFQENESAVKEVLDFYPRQGEEENAVWMMAHSAQNAGVTLVDVSLAKELPTAQAVVPIPVTTATTPPVPGGIQIGSEALTSKSFSIKFVSVGNYETFKRFADLLEKMPRRHRVEKITIQKVEGEKGEVFKMSGTVSFGYAPMRQVQPGIISPAFKNATFDFSVLEAIKEDRATYSVSDTISSGRANPFVP